MTHLIYNSLYSKTTSGPEEYVGRIGTNFTSGRTSDPVDLRMMMEREALSER